MFTISLYESYDDITWNGSLWRIFPFDWSIMGDINSFWKSDDKTLDKQFFRDKMISREKHNKNMGWKFRWIWLVESLVLDSFFGALASSHVWSWIPFRISWYKCWICGKLESVTKQEITLPNYGNILDLYSHQLNSIILFYVGPSTY